MISERVLSELTPFLQRFGTAISPAGGDNVPHTQLRLALHADPGMDALLAGYGGSIALGDDGDAPFRIRADGLLLLAPQWIDEPAALALAARWGIEAFHKADGHAMGVIRHGIALLDLAPERVRRKVHRHLPGELTLEWLQTRLCGITARDSGESPCELDLPVEHLLLAGGDSRLVLDPRTGLNRYGVCPRPRPEAVHFSSSTASAISDHGFLFCEMLRRARPGRQTLVNKVGEEILHQLGLAKEDADVILTPSGTDAELVSVMLSLAKGSSDLVNVLIAPDESGKGVKLAGEGRFFDGASKGKSAFEGRDIRAVEIPIRDEQCRIRSMDHVRADVEKHLHQASHTLVHVLHVSKTGLSAPSLDICKVISSDTDVVVDACQMRTPLHELGALVRQGCMVQVSGSKFYTGPPFAGAVIVSVRFRERLENIRHLLQKAPTVSHPADWSSWWRQRLETPAPEPSHGALFRWLPALMESHLYSQTDPGMRAWAFEEFRSQVLQGFARSPHLRPIADDVAGSDFAKLSIIAFQVTSGGQPLGEKESTWLFEHLNCDISGILPDMTEEEQTIARLPCHIGQPVVLSEQLSFLRLVLGARFFNIVCHTRHPEAALASEIADAKRVLAKLEWMASRWERLKLLVK